jgi:putative peptidoglycan lipid II flippase
VAEPDTRRGRRLALNTAFFSIATGLSRVAGLAREVVAASYFGVTGPMSAFTIAFQVPNLMRALFADAALQGAFVPVFTELLERGERKEAFRVASSLCLLIILILGSFTLVFVIAAPAVMQVVAPGFASQPLLRDLTAGLSQLMFPIVLLMAVSGVIVGMLNSFEHFIVPALAPVAWNLVIIAAMVGLSPLFEGPTQIYTYAWGVLVGTVVQLVLPMPWLRGRGGRLSLALDWRSPHVRRVLKLMLPVTLALGLINFSLLINSFFGTLVNPEAPAAIDKAFRIYQLPQGLFSVAVATILFPTLSRYAARGAYSSLRHTMATGIRQICLLLIPSAVFMAVLAEPITRLVYQRGAFNASATDLVSQAMFWWSFSLPFQGMSLLFSRTFFSLQRPWATTLLAVGDLCVNALVALALYAPFGVAGVVLGTVLGTIGMTVVQGLILRKDLHGIEGKLTLTTAAKILLASACLGLVSYGLWRELASTVGAGGLAEVVSLGGAILGGLVVYGATVWLLNVHEAKQIVQLVAGRFSQKQN